MMAGKPDDMNRRTFLESTAAGLASVALAGTASAAAPSRILDAHVHFYDTSRPQGVPWPPPTSSVLYMPTYPGRYLENIKPFSVNCVVAIEASPWLEDNLWLLQVADQYPLIKAVIGNIRPGHPDFKDALDRFSKHPLLRGIRIGSNSVPEVMARPEALAGLKQLSEKDLSLDILLGGPSIFAEAARLAERLPDLRIVIEHLPLDPTKDDGGRAAFKESMRALGRCPNVFAKVSGVVRRVNGRNPADAGFYKAGLDELWETFGPDRVVFATNWPASDGTAPAPVVFRVILDYLADKDQDLIDKYFFRNSVALYKWKER